MELARTVHRYFLGLRVIQYLGREERARRVIRNYFERVGCSNPTALVSEMKRKLPKGMTVREAIPMIEGLARAGELYEIPQKELPGNHPGRLEDTRRLYRAMNHENR